jgi:hypothetical protein
MPKRRRPRKAEYAFFAPFPETHAGQRVGEQVREAQRTEQDYLGNERLTVTRTIDGRGRQACPHWLGIRNERFSERTTQPLNRCRSVSNTKLSNGSTHAKSELHGLHAGETADIRCLIACAMKDLGQGCGVQGTQVTSTHSGSKPPHASHHFLNGTIISL